MKTIKSSQRSQGTKTDVNHNVNERGSLSNARSNINVSMNDRPEEPSPIPKPSPDMPPGPARREYDDTGHEHVHKDPSAFRKLNR